MKQLFLLFFPQENTNVRTCLRQTFYGPQILNTRVVENVNKVRNFALYIYTFYAYMLLFCAHVDDLLFHVPVSLIFVPFLVHHSIFSMLDAPYNLIHHSSNTNYWPGFGCRSRHERKIRRQVAAAAAGSEGGIVVNSHQRRGSQDSLEDSSLDAWKPSVYWVMFYLSIASCIVAFTGAVLFMEVGDGDWIHRQRLIRKIFIIMKKKKTFLYSFFLVVAC